jgi:hypothetical protein
MRHHISNTRTLALEDNVHLNQLNSSEAFPWRSELRGLERGSTRYLGDDREKYQEGDVEGSIYSNKPKGDKH